MVEHLNNMVMVRDKACIMMMKLQLSVSVCYQDLIDTNKSTHSNFIVLRWQYCESANSYIIFEVFMFI